MFQVLSLQPTTNSGTPCHLPHARLYKKRKTHAKSRDGCRECKAKRVKCDEVRPSCCRCRRAGTVCSFITQAESASSSESPSSESPRLSIITTTSSPNNSTNESVTLLPFLPPMSQTEELYGLPPSKHHASPGSGATTRLHLLHHFRNVFTPQQVFKPITHDPTVQLALTRPHLLFAMLAVSASHLRHHTTTTTTRMLSSPDLATDARVAEHTQRALAISSFQNALTTPPDSSRDGDALLLTSMLLNVMAFALPDSEDANDPRSSWVFDADGDAQTRLGWVGLQMGLKPLLQATENLRDGTILSWMYEASDTREGVFYGAAEPHPLIRVPASWLRLVGLARDAQPSAAPLFYGPVRVLAELRDIEPTQKSCLLYFAFVGQLELAFRRLLERNDERALWLFGYWLGLMARYAGGEDAGGDGRGGFWWMRARVRRDRAAIRLWLEGVKGVTAREGEEGEMWRVLIKDFDRAPYWSEGSEASEFGSVLVAEE